MQFSKSHPLLLLFFFTIISIFFNVLNIQQHVVADATSSSESESCAAAAATNPYFDLDNGADKAELRRLTAAVDSDPNDIDALKKRVAFYDKHLLLNESAKDLVKISTAYQAASEEDLALKYMLKALPRAEVLAGLNKIKSHPKDAQSWFRWIKSHPIEEDIRCVKTFTKILEIVGDSNVKANVNLLSCAVFGSFFPTAKVRFTVMKKIDPDNLDVLYLRGVYNFMLNNFTAASAEVNRCLTIDPNNKQCGKLEERIGEVLPVVNLAEDATTTEDWQNVIAEVSRALESKSSVMFRPFLDRFVPIDCKAGANIALLRRSGHHHDQTATQGEGSTNDHNIIKTKKESDVGRCSSFAEKTGSERLVMSEHDPLAKGLRDKSKATGYKFLTRLAAEAHSYAAMIYHDRGMKKDSAEQLAAALKLDRNNEHVRYFHRVLQHRGDDNNNNNNNRDEVNNVLHFEQERE